MELIYLLAAVAALCLWLWVTVLSVLCLFLDPDLESVQRWGQLIIVILAPFYGAIFILKMVNEHSPEVVERFYIPWPFRNMVLDKSLRRGGTGHNSEEQPGSHSGSYSGGSDGGGGGD